MLPRYFEAEGYDYRIIEEDTYSIVKNKSAGQDLLFVVLALASRRLVQRRPGTGGLQVGAGPSS